MAHTKSAKRLIRVMEERRIRNRSTIRAIKTYIGKAEKLIVAKETDSARNAVKQAEIALDKAAQKGVIHSNNASRRKSRLLKRFNSAFPTA